MRHAESQMNACNAKIKEKDVTDNYIIPDEERFTKFMQLKGDRSLVNVSITEKGINQAKNEIFLIMAFKNII